MKKIEHYYPDLWYQSKEWRNDTEIPLYGESCRMVVVEGHPLFAESDIKKIVNQLRRYEIQN